MKTQNKFKNRDIEYDIDYDLFKTEEIIKIINFFNLVLKYENSNCSINELKHAYNNYRTILNNKSLEKKYDEMFYKQTGLSIYCIMRDLGC